MEANESRLPVPVRQKEHGHADTGTARGMNDAATESLVESIQGSLYGEKEEKWIESLKMTMIRDAFSRSLPTRYYLPVTLSI
jgi:hypothetical protein